MITRRKIIGSMGVIPGVMLADAAMGTIPFAPPEKKEPDLYDSTKAQYPVALRPAVGNALEAVSELHALAYDMVLAGYTEWKYLLKSSAVALHYATFINSLMAEGSGFVRAVAWSGADASRVCINNCASFSGFAEVVRGAQTLSRLEGILRTIG